MKKTTIELISPFDAHMHWRQKGGLLEKVAPYSMAQFSGGLLMPNITPPIMSARSLHEYRRDVFEVVGADDFLPVFTYNLSPSLSVNDLLSAWDQESIVGVKSYPKGGTTNSQDGIEGFTEVSHILEAMQKAGIPLLIHGEVPVHHDKVLDDFERETVFYETQMETLRTQYPGLRMVMEHITTSDAADFVLRHDNVVATITPQHLLFDYRALFNGVDANQDGFVYNAGTNGMNPSQMCRPILKNTKHVKALREALSRQYNEGFSKFGLGTDTAPHTSDKKYCECGACGVFSAPIALQLYAMAFDEANILEHLPVFACDVMPDFYGLKEFLPYKKLILDKCALGTEVQKDYHGVATPFAGQTLPWAVLKEN
jgi:dihydroorotase